MSMRLAVGLAVVVVSAAAARVPPALLDQLGEDGRLVMPLGTPQAQTLALLQRQHGRLLTTSLGGCLFVPLITS